MRNMAVFIVILAILSTCLIKMIMLSREKDFYYRLYIQADLQKKKTDVAYLRLMERVKEELKW